MLGISWSAGWSPLSLAMTALAGLLEGYIIGCGVVTTLFASSALCPDRKLYLCWTTFSVENTFDKRLFVEWIKWNGYLFRVWISYYPMLHVFIMNYWSRFFPIKISKQKSGEYKFFLPENCLAVLSGDKWRPRRKLLTPAFHFKILDEFMPTFNEKSMASVAKMEEILGTAGSKEIDVFSIMTELVFDVFCETSMGKNTWSEEKKNTFAKSLQCLENILIERAIRKPWLRIDWIYKLTALYRKQQQYSSFFDTVHEKVIRERREFHRENAEKYSNQPVMNNNADEEVNFSRPISEENPDFDDKMIGDEISLFMTAKLVIEELDLVFGESYRPGTAQDLTQLKYMERCIKETLRLYPPLPVAARCLTEEVQVGAYTLPKDLTVLINIGMTHRIPEVFPEPDAFKPERFLPENCIGRHPYAFIPLFSAGPRNCIGGSNSLTKII
ncbi:cytochrome P450 4c3-like [Daphnia pulex]|uniref:cytochrome P450 4c3-like n=1 Tax=Daphnia pulex TaxID=6669 RepID=UPI001EE07FFB|nr:cytochrome P450 4c3-like [Daphnia pulex]